MKKFLTAIKTLSACLSVLALCSCSQEQTALNGTDLVLDDNLLRSRTRYEATINGRGDHAERSFEIQSVTRSQTTLSVVVKGGCDAAAFTFVWDGRVAESDPTQVWLVLTHDGSINSCGSESIHQLDLDLSKLQLSQTDLDNCIVHVGNGSMKEDLSIDANGTVTR